MHMLEMTKNNVVPLQGLVWRFVVPENVLVI